MKQGNVVLLVSLGALGGHARVAIFLPLLLC